MKRVDDEDIEPKWWRTTEAYLIFALFLVAAAIIVAVLAFGSPFSDDSNCVTPLMNGGCPFG